MVSCFLATCWLAFALCPGFVEGAPITADPPLAGQWRLSLDRPGWSPRLAQGTLVLRSEPWRGELGFDSIVYSRTAALDDLEVDSDSLSFTFEVEDCHLSFRGKIQGDGLSGQCVWKGVGEFSWTAERAKSPKRFDEPPSSESFDRAETLPEDIDVIALERLITIAEKNGSDSLVVLKDGALICERYFGRPRGPIEAMSVTKSVVGLAAALAVQEGDLESFESPVHEFFPEWDTGMKKDVTMRHLLTQTSGLHANPTTEAIYASEDFVKFALDSELDNAPGTRFFYNNRATNLIAGVLREACGLPMDEYLDGLLFEPMDIKEYSWNHDPSGNPHAMAGLQIHALDLAKIGQMILDRGQWQGEEVLDASLIDETMSPVEIRGNPSEPFYSHLWWLTPQAVHAEVDEELFAQWEQGGAKKDFLDKMRPLVGTRFEDDGTRSGKSAYLLAAMRALAEDPDKVEPEAIDPPELLELSRETTQRGVPMCRLRLGPIAAYSAQGYLGQWLVIVPESRVVVVRQRRYRPGPAPDGAIFRSIVSLVRAL